MSQVHAQFRQGKTRESPYIMRCTREVIYCNFQIIYSTQMDLSEDNESFCHQLLFALKGSLKLVNV